MALVEVTQQDGWTEVALNDPATRNAITGPMVESLIEVLKQSEEDSNSQLVMLRGSEGAFCSGLNLKQFNADPPPEWLPRFQTLWRSLHVAMYEFKKPIVVALERFAINGGSALALAGDLLVAGEDSYLQVGEVTQGMQAAFNVAWLSLRHSESAKAQLTLTGRRFFGTDLVRLGIALEAPPTKEVVNRTSELCSELAAYPNSAVANMKKAISSYREQSDGENWFQRSTGSGRRGPITPVSN